MGPGDEVVVTLRGQENSDVRTSVDRNGRVVLPRLSPIPAAGRDFGSFRQDVDAAVRLGYVASIAAVASGGVRRSCVRVACEGDVVCLRSSSGPAPGEGARLTAARVHRTR